MDMQLGDLLRWTTQGALNRVGNIADYVEDDRTREVIRYTSKHPVRDQKPYLRSTKPACLTARGLGAQPDPPGSTSTADPGGTSSAIAFYLEPARERVDHFFK